MPLSVLLASPNITTCSNITQAALANVTGNVTSVAGYMGIVLSEELPSLRDSIIEVILLTMLIGLFTTLACVAAYILIMKGIKQKANCLMLIAITTMWIATTAYWITTLIATERVYSDVYHFVSASSHQMSDSLNCLYSMSLSGYISSASEDCKTWYREDYTTLGPPAYRAYTFQECAGTVALTTNVLIGDSIVWWRALVLWPGSKVVRIICVAMILLTTDLVTSTMDTTKACINDLNRNLYLIYGNSINAGNMFVGNALGVITVFASLSTNIVATVLIAYRACEHRRILMSYLKASSPRTQVQRTLALLVESGILYSTLWIILAVYALGNELITSIWQPSDLFLSILRYTVLGCVIPLIGIYPTIVIIVCAADKSLYEKAAEDHARNGSIALDLPLSSHRTLSELVSKAPPMTFTSEVLGSTYEVSLRDASKLDDDERSTSPGDSSSLSVITPLPRRVSP